MSTEFAYAGKLIAERFDLVQELAALRYPGVTQWIARDTILSRKLRAIAVDPDAPERSSVTDAARRSALITDPAATSILSVVESGGGTVIFTEVPPGTPVSSYLHGEPLDPQLAWAILGETATAVNNMRHRGIRHLDLHPSDVLIQDSGEIVVDGFGIHAALAGINLNREPSELDQDEAHGLTLLLAQLIIGQDSPEGDSSLLERALSFDIPAEVRHIFERELRSDGATSPDELMRRLAPWPGIDRRALPLPVEKPTPGPARTLIPGETGEEHAKFSRPVTFPSLGAAAAAAAAATLEASEAMSTTEPDVPPVVEAAEANDVETDTDDATADSITLNTDVIEPAVALENSDPDVDTTATVASLVDVDSDNGVEGTSTEVQDTGTDSSGPDTPDYDDQDTDGEEPSLEDVAEGTDAKNGNANEVEAGPAPATSLDEARAVVDRVLGIDDHEPAVTAAWPALVASTMARSPAVVDASMEDEPSKTAASAIRLRQASAFPGPRSVSRTVLLIFVIAFLVVAAWGISQTFKPLEQVEVTSKGSYIDLHPAESQSEDGGEVPAPAEEPAVPAADAVVDDITLLNPDLALMPDPDPAMDSPTLVSRAVDGDPNTRWSSWTHLAQNLSPMRGIGLHIQLAEPATISSIVVDVDGTGGNIQWRDASAGDPAGGSLIAESDMSGSTELVAEQPITTDSIVLWITELPKSAETGNNRADITEIYFR